MSPEMARVFIVEDQGMMREFMRSSLVRAGHVIVGEANRIEAAIEATTRFDEMGVQVIIIDGNLTLDDVSGDDGQAVLGAVRQNAPHVKTVGMSFSKKGVPGTDLNLGKQNMSKLGDEVTQL